MVRTLILTASLLAIGAGAAVAAAPPTWKLRLQQLVARGLWLCAGDRAGAGLPVLGDGLRADLQLVRGRVDDGLRRRDELRARGRHEDAGDLRAGTRPGGRTWYTITGSTSAGGPISGNPLRLATERPAHLGHVYRTVATARLVVPNGHAGCSLSNTCYETITLTATSRPLAP